MSDDEAALDRDLAALSGSGSDSGIENSTKEVEYYSGDAKVNSYAGSESESDDGVVRGRLSEIKKAQPKKGKAKRKKAGKGRGEDSDDEIDVDAEVDAMLGIGTRGGAGADSDEEGEDLMGDDMLRDYLPDPELDRYDPSQLDDQAYEPMSAAQRSKAEAVIRARAARHKRAGKRRRKDRSQEMDDRGGMSRLPQALQEMSSSEDDAGFDDLIVRRAGAAVQQQRFISPDDPEAREDALALEPELFEEGAEDEEDGYDLEEARGNTREWIAMDGPRRAIAKRFHKFLERFEESGRKVYPSKVVRMCSQNRTSLLVSYTHLSRDDSTLRIAMWLAEQPAEMLNIFDEVAKTVVGRMFPTYLKNVAQEEIRVRIIDVPVVDSLRSLRQHHLNALVKVSGVVTRRSGVLPQLRYVKYDCHACGFVLGPFFIDAQDAQQNRATPGACPQCQARGPFNVNSEQTVYRNFQRINLQETPGSVPAGRLPRAKTVVLTGDLIDIARPGEEVEVTGVYRNNYDSPLNMATGFPVFTTVIEANYVEKLEDSLAGFRLTQDDEAMLTALAKRDSRIGQRIIRSIAPSIFGHDDVKTAIALALFGGVAKMVDQRHRIRGDINCLLLGDPGVAKSQLLKFVEKTAHRAVYTTGQGASAVGLTAAVRKDTVTGEWVLEGGALVLADHGICLIDEFDKMNDRDRTSIHEAMEQQTISISKAGIVTTLQARCAVIAAANPIGGRYDPTVPFSRNVELTDPILSRFDILCVLRDSVQPVLDRRLAQFVVESHHRSHPHHAQDVSGITSADAELTKAALAASRDDGMDQFGGSFVPGEDIKPLSQDMLRKYMVYAKRKQPKLSGIDVNKLKQLYAHLRSESYHGGAVPITVRHIESIVRMAEAHARMHLRDFVADDDVNMAIRVALESFISAQKSTIARSMRSQFVRYITFARDSHELLLHALRLLVEEHRRIAQLKGGSAAERAAEGVVELPADDFSAHAQELMVHDEGVTTFYTSDLFKKNNFRLDPNQGLIIWNAHGHARVSTPRSTKSRARATPRRPTEDDDQHLL